jgi:polyhydroxyalkanoate synthesis repressor PhaR
MNRKPVIIKKYENRRLYDTTNSRYINQDEVAQMLQSGYDVQVVDAATGEDLTRLVLTQIIVEQAKAPNSAFPLDVLREMVVASSRATQESTLKYMKTALDMYQNAYRAITPPVNPFEFMQPTARQEPPESESGMQRGMAASRPARKKVSDKKSERDVVGELKRRVAELESHVLGRSAKKPRKRKAASRRKP